ncbi:hypothetical protein D3C86_1473720 [compost metagenome]
MGDEFAQLSHVALVVAAEPGLTGDDLAEDLRIAQQLADQRTFALHRGFRLLGLERSNHFIALGVEYADLLRIGRHRRQPLHTREDALLQGIDLALDIAGLAGLTEGDVDLYQVVQGLQVAPQGQAAAQQVEALQFDPGALEFAIGIAYQIEVGHQHRHEEQHADQTELHPETQAVHQRDGGIEQALHG